MGVKRIEHVLELLVDCSRLLSQFGDLAVRRVVHAAVRGLNQLFIRGLGAIRVARAESVDHTLADPNCGLCFYLLWLVT